jgi:hypothetical protein
VLSSSLPEHAVDSPRHFACIAVRVGRRTSFSAEGRTRPAPAFSGIFGYHDPSRLPRQKDVILGFAVVAEHHVFAEAVVEPEIG